MSYNIPSDARAMARINAFQINTSSTYRAHSGSTLFSLSTLRLINDHAAKQQATETAMRHMRVVALAAKTFYFCVIVVVFYCFRFEDISFRSFRVATVFLHPPPFCDWSEWNKYMYTAVRTMIYEDDTRLVGISMHVLWWI